MDDASFPVFGFEHALANFDENAPPQFLMTQIPSPIYHSFIPGPLNRFGGSQFLLLDHFSSGDGGDGLVATVEQLVQNWNVKFSKFGNLDEALQKYTPANVIESILAFFM